MGMSTYQYYCLQSACVQPFCNYHKYTITLVYAENYFVYIAYLQEYKYIFERFW
jgi:hypothetical protein